MAQGDEPNAKDDTRLYATGASITNCTTDLSQYASDLTAGTGCVYAADSARWSEATLPWAVELVCTANSTDTGYMYYHASTSAGLRLEMTAGPVLEARVNGAVSATLSVTVSGVGGTREDLVVAWTMEANVFTTGASDAAISWLRCWNTTDSTYFETWATHAVPVDATGQAIWGARTTAGSGAYTGVITEIRWSVGRTHPPAEVREDLIATTSAPTLAFQPRREIPVPTKASGAGDDGMFVGPVLMAASAGLRQLDIRQAGAVLSELYRDASTLNESPAAIRSLADPDGSAFTFYGQFLHHRPIPRTCNRLLVRVHIQSWRTDMASPDTVNIRCYSMRRPPGPGPANKLPEPWTRFYVEEAVTAEHGSGTTGGVWVTFDPLMIARDRSQQGSWFCLAFSVTEDLGMDTSAQAWRIRAWTIEPGVIDSAGEIPLGGLA